MNCKMQNGYMIIIHVSYITISSSILSLLDMSVSRSIFNFAYCYYSFTRFSFCLWDDETIFNVRIFKKRVACAFYLSLSFFWIKFQKELKFNLWSFKGQRVKRFNSSSLFWFLCSLTASYSNNINWEILTFRFSWENWTSKSSYSRIACNIKHNE